MLTFAHYPPKRQLSTCDFPFRWSLSTVGSGGGTNLFSGGGSARCNPAAFHGALNSNYAQFALVTDATGVLLSIGVE
jgi:hypothetical protein